MRWWGGLRAAVGRWTAAVLPRHRYESGPIDALVRGIWGSAGFDDVVVGREEALGIAAVSRGRDQICAIGTLPLVSQRGQDVVPAPFLDQPDPDVPRVVMYAQTLEDLLCDGISWWRKTSTDYRGFPLTARRMLPGSVSVNPPAGRTPAPLPSGTVANTGAVLWVDGNPVPAAEMIRFDSPNRPLLARQRVLRRALLLDRLAAMYADNPRPLETFTDSDDQTVRESTTDQIDAFLAEYKVARKRGLPAWIPKSIMRSDVSAPSPAELQLVELQKQVTLEIANLIGIDAEEVGVSTTSRTYFNAIDRDRQKINNTLGAYMSAITDRLSMTDITPRGQRVRFDLTDYLKPDPGAQVAYWKGLKDMGVVGVPWIARQAGVSAADVPDEQPASPPAQDPAQVQAHWGPPIQPRRPLALPAGPARFDAGPGYVFATAEFAAATEAPKVDQATRTITGLALPYNAIARKYGVGFRFKPGSLEYTDVSRLKALMDHGTAVGFHQEATDGRAGMSVKLKILDGPDGSPAKLQRDQLLYDAQNGLYDGLSVGVDFDLMTDATWNEDDQVFDVHRASWRETSITPLPAFDDARVTSVAASRTGAPMNCQHCGRAHPAGIACQTYAQMNPAPPAAQPQVFDMAQHVAATRPGQYWSPLGGVLPLPAQPQQPGPVAQQVLSQASTTEALTAALGAYVNDAIAAGQVAGAPPASGTPGHVVDAGHQVAQQYAQPVNPLYDAGRGNARVIEPDPYRIGFDRRTGDAILHRGSHDFSADLHAALMLGDGGANARALKFIQDRMIAAFNVATTDVDELNPTRQRPDMYVDQRQYRYPMWTAVNKGSLTDITPFKFPKFNSASGLVGAHTEGTEPSTGSFTTTGQTVTPSAYSGKAKINREVWDQGGNPQLSTLIWNQMVRGVNEALEAAVVTLLNAGSYTALATLTAGGTDRAAAGALLGNELSGGFAALQFARGGFFITDVFGQADLYLTLLKATDDAGRPLYPMLGASNANGTTGNRFGEIDLGGVTIDPAWALAAAGQTAATKSYAIDRQSVHGWASAPQRITMDAIAVATVEIGVWGYQATAVSDDNGVRTITWDPVA